MISQFCIPWALLPRDYAFFSVTLLLIFLGVGPLIFGEHVDLGQFCAVPFGFTRPVGCGWVALWYFNSIFNRCLV